MVGLDWKLDMFKITRKTLFRLIQAAAIARCTPYLYSLHKGSTLSRGSFCVKALYRTDRGCTCTCTPSLILQNISGDNSKRVTSIYLILVVGLQTRLVSIIITRQASFLRQSTYQVLLFSHFLLDIDRGINAASAIRGWFLIPFVGQVTNSAGC